MLRVMLYCGRGLLLFVLWNCAGWVAHAQSFAFLNSKEAHDNCANATDAERSAAIALAEASLNRRPSALPHIHTDGLLPHQGIRDQSLEAERDWGAARDLAVGYCAAGRADFRDHATAILTDWVKQYQLDYDPGDEAKIVQLFLAADLVSDAMSPAQASAWNSFARKFADGYTAQAEASGTQDIGKRQSERIELAAVAAYAIADQQLIDRTQSVLTVQIGRNITASGAVYDFTRHDALRAVVEDLEPLLVAAVAAHNHGVNWYGIPAASGATLESALAWLAPYASGNATHTEFADSQAPFDYERKNAGEAGFSGEWQPSEAAAVYLYASALDRQWATLATSLNGPPPLWQRLMMGMP